jgi:predicted nucleic acid-binding protein
VSDSNAVLTLDTSVLVAALRPAEPAHAACRGLLDRVLRGEARATMPATVLVELACAIARRTGDERVPRTLRTPAETTAHTGGGALSPHAVSGVISIW